MATKSAVESAAVVPGYSKIEKDTGFELFSAGAIAFFAKNEKLGGPTTPKKTQGLASQAVRGPGVCLRWQRRQRRWVML